MAHAVADDACFTRERYFALVDEGLLEPEDRVELLEGVVVAMAPSNPPHAVVTELVAAALRGAVLRSSVGSEAAVRVQHSFDAGPRSVPAPDVVLVPGRHVDYLKAHPSRALLIVEVADSSLPQDRLTKLRIYAAAAVPEYWIVNLRDDVVEVHRASDPAGRTYRERRVARRGERLELGALPGTSVAVDDLLPPLE
jgi:Uma2 family endonuclease